MIFALLGCAKTEISPEMRIHGAALGWKWYSVGRETFLSFGGHEIPQYGKLVTPFGIMVWVEAEDAQSGRGWARESPTTASQVPVTGLPLTATDLSEGFYQAPLAGKRPGTPSEWVYLCRVANPGWIAPSRLQDRSFRLAHPETAARTNGC